MGEEYTYEQLKQLSYVDIGADFLFILNSFALLRIVSAIYKNHKDKNFKLSPENL